MRIWKSCMGSFQLGKRECRSANNFLLLFSLSTTVEVLLRPSDNPIIMKPLKSTSRFP
jgi:hypothetical protein